MKFALNLLWFVFGGIWLGLLFCISSSICFVSIIGIPYGIACCRIARFAFLPFGKDLIPNEMMGGRRIFGTGLMNFIWCLFFGFWLSVVVALYGIFWCCTIIGIPWGIACFKISKVSFAPLGKTIVSTEVAKAARERWAKETVNKAFADK